MKIARCILFCLFVQTIGFAQIPLLQWQKSFGGTNDDAAYAIKQTIDGGYIVVGSSASQDGDVTGNHYNSQYPEDFWIVKTDACGTLLWQKSLGGTGRDIAYSVQQTTDKGYIVAGFTSSTDGDITTYHGGASDFWIVKLDTLGMVKWQKTLGGAGEEGAQAIHQTTDGGYVAVGWSSSNGDTAGDHDFDYWIVKLDTGGNVKWQKLYGGLNDDTPYDIQQTIDGGYIAVGYSQSNDGDVSGHHGVTGVSDYWVIKTDTAGNLKWQKSYGGAQEDEATSVQQTADGGYIVAGYALSNNGDVIGNHGAYDYWILKTDTAGVILWQDCLGGTNNEQAYSINKLTDGGYTVAGVSYSTNGEVTGNHGGIGDYWVTNLNASGIIQWQKTLGGSGADAASAIQQTADGELIVTGASNSNNGDITASKGAYDYWIVKLNTIMGDTSICIGNSATLTAMGASSYTWSPGGIVSSSITITPVSNTVYTLTVSTGTCTVNSHTVNVKVNSLPIVTFSTLGFRDTTCSMSGNQNLTGGMPVGGIYSGPGVTAAVFNPFTAGIGTYSLAYSYTDINNCSNSANHSVTVQSCATTDVSSFDQEDKIMFYPNPFISDLQIVSNIFIKKIIIYDDLGNKIRELTLANNINKLTLDMYGLTPGIYFSEIYFSDNTRIIKKINKQ